MNKEDLRNKMGGIEFDVGCECDNLAIILCTYFSYHLARPEDDEDGDSGWGEWVENKTNKVLDQLADKVQRMNSIDQEMTQWAENKAIKAATSAAMPQAPEQKQEPLPEFEDCHAWAEAIHAYDGGAKYREQEYIARNIGRKALEILGPDDTENKMRAAVEWQPGNTAPKDCLPFLAWHGGKLREARYSVDSARFYNWEIGEIKPKYWMRPQPPKDKTR
jgi:hypothetical protein